MPLLQVRNLDKFYGATPILRDASLVVQPGEKWGLVGRNGAGKTTLFKILTGVEDYDRGEIHWIQNCRIGYLEQSPQFTGESIYKELRAIFQELDQLRAEITHLEEEMSQPGLPEVELHRLVDEHHTLSESYEEAGGYQIEGRIQGVLRGLGFPRERWEDSPTVLSGGEQTRLALARILLTECDLLFLDEPTNYLDLAAIEWLEEFLQEFKGAVILISHDRFFLDRVVTGIFEIEACAFRRYSGNYTAYRTQKEAQYQNTLKTYQEQEKEIARLEKFVRESRATEKAKRKAHSIEKRIAKMERVERPQQEQGSMKLSFQERRASSRQVLSLEGIQKRYGPKTILNGLDLQIEYGEKIGLVGPNGAGKTTLLKIILGQETSDGGRIRFGYEVTPGYFPQLIDASSLTGTPLSQVLDAADLDQTEARTILGRFLFSGESVFKSVADLSGGECRRLFLIKLMLSHANLLILDEPTNHLDLDSIETVEKALTEFPGTVLTVSHDRYFLNRLVDRYVALVDGRLQSFDSYQEYLDWRRLKEAATGNVGKSITQTKPKNALQLQREQQKLLQREFKQKTRQLETLESEIEQLETRQKEILTLLNDPSVQTDYRRSQELGQELTGVEAALEEEYQKWEVLQQELHLLKEDASG